ncbi:hypothetical protein DFJ74DRAFT_442765 [Hyaloraphidium curvatum]|nr:hypothetical protein DFJ74DRAFT_442765 [Hyaloraphidium curvatum]
MDDRVASALSRLRAAASPRAAPAAPVPADAYRLPLAVRARLATFSPRTWHAKPVGLLDAATCAAAGWENSGPDALECRDCGRRLLVKVREVSHPATEEDKREAELQMAVARTYHAKLASAHAEGCRFPRAAASPDEMAFPRVPGAAAAELLAGRAAEIGQIPDGKLPKEVSFGGRPLSQAIPDALLQSLLSLLPSSPSPTPLALALAGWSPSPPSSLSALGKHALHCTFCLRTAPLWLSERFDALREHERWCPWVARGVEGRAGWEEAGRAVAEAKGAGGDAGEGPPRKRYRVSVGGEEGAGDAGEGEEVLTLDAATKRIRSLLYG